MAIGNVQITQVHLPRRAIFKADFAWDSRAFINCRPRPQRDSTCRDSVHINFSGVLSELTYNRYPRAKGTP